MARSWAAVCAPTPSKYRSRWICCGVPSGHSGGTWSGASWTPSAHPPSTQIACQRSLHFSTAPSRKPAQNPLSASMSAASKTIIRCLMSIRASLTAQVASWITYGEVHGVCCEGKQGRVVPCRGGWWWGGVRVDRRDVAGVEGVSCRRDRQRAERPDVAVPRAAAGVDRQPGAVHHRLPVRREGVPVL